MGPPKRRRRIGGSEARTTGISRPGFARLAASHHMRPFSLVLLVFLLTACGTNEEPADIRQGRTVYGGLCGACHGARGEGNGGPPLANLTENWPECKDQITWIELGSDGWRLHEGATYGAMMKPVEGGMPAYSNVLDPRQIQQVAAFTRTEYSDQDVGDALRACGLDRVP